ncbi:MAG: hypothetical protein Q9205_005685 [Flavoplaca limonia]
MLDVLRVLTTVGDISESAWNERYDWGGDYRKKIVGRIFKGASGWVIILGMEEEEHPADGGDGSIHNLGLVGHIEDIAVAKDQQGKKLGLRIIQALDELAEKVGCYKTILDCSETNEGFYVKCGYKRAGLEMAHYYGKK